MAECTLETYQSVACDLADELPQTGRFVIIDNYEIAGGGVILEAPQDSDTLIQKHVARREQAWDRSSITTEMRIGRFTQRSALIVLCGPATLIPHGVQKQKGVEVSHDLSAALKRADVVIMLRIQKERQDSQYFPSMREYKKYFSLNEESVKFLRKETLVMHPGPVNWDTEISSSLKDRFFGPILEQVTNGLAVRMAVLYLLSLGKEKV
jgi:hypothetical protein